MAVPRMRRIHGPRHRIRHPHLRRVRVDLVVGYTDAGGDIQIQHDSPEVGRMRGRTATIRKFQPMPWRQHAACTGTTRNFYPERGENTDQAKQICRTCPAQTECLNYALDNGERLGIWGGMSERERRKERSRRRGIRLAAAARSGLKWCPRCETEQPLDRFHADARNRDGRQGFCRDCRSTKQPTP